MKRVNVHEGIVPLTEFRSRAAELIEQLEHGPIVLTQHGRSVAVMVPPEEYERLAYTEEFKAAVNEGLASLTAGKGIPHREAMAELRRRQREREAKRKAKA